MLHLPKRSLILTGAQRVHEHHLNFSLLRTNGFDPIRDGFETVNNWSLQDIMAKVPLDARSQWTSSQLNRLMLVSGLNIKDYCLMVTVHRKNRPQLASSFFDMTKMINDALLDTLKVGESINFTKSFKRGLKTGLIISNLKKAFMAAI